MKNATVIYISNYTVTKAEVSDNQCIFDFEIETPIINEATLVVGVYNRNNQLIGIRNCVADLSSGIVNQTAFAVDFVGVPYKYKIILWDNENNLTPIIENYNNLF